MAVSFKDVVPKPIRMAVKPAVRAARRPLLAAILHKLATDRAILRPVRRRDYLHILTGREDMALKMSAARLLRPKFLCVNDVGGKQMTQAREDRLLATFLRVSQKRPSPYEVS